MAETEYRLDPRDASMVVSTLRCLARIIDPEPGHEPLALSDGQVQVLTYPAAVLPYTRDRPLFAERLRELARAIEEQLPGEAPQPAPERPRRS
jgi:hypothetical protein